MKKAIVLGSLGMSGSHLIDLLLSKNYEIKGIARQFNQKVNSYKNQNITFAYLNLLSEDGSKDNLKKIIDSFEPNEIYNFAGVSDVFSPWEQQEEIFKINALLPQYICQSIVEVNKDIRFFQASSILTFGNNDMGEFSPKYPYGVAKKYADDIIKEYRREFGIFVCSGIFGSHESPRRGKHFFSKKITDFVKSVKNGNKEKLKVGSLHQKRNIGYAPDYMEAAFLMLNADEAEDYIIGNNKFANDDEEDYESSWYQIDKRMISDEEFVKKCFNYVGLNWQDYIDVDENLSRKFSFPIDVDATEIKNSLGWSATHDVDDIIKIMMEND